VTDPDPSAPPAKPLVEYPTVYTFKVMGKQEGEFREHIRKGFGKVLGTEVFDDSITEQPSRKGNFVSLNVTVYLQTEAQRVALYAFLHGEERVVFYL
jgi:uncharacterized protein